MAPRASPAHRPPAAQARLKAVHALRPGTSVNAHLHTALDVRLAALKAEEEAA